MRSGIDETPSFIREEARKGGIGVRIFNFLSAALPLTSRLATPSESLRALKADQSGIWHSVSSKRDYLLICVVKTWEVVPERMKGIEMGIVLVTPILVKWWMNMMWFVIGALARKMVLGSSSAVVRHDRVVTPAQKDSKSSAIVLSLR